MPDLIRQTMTYRLRLTGGFEAALILPADLTSQEAERIDAFVKSLVLDDA